MKIKSVKIENLRSFKGETVPFDDYTCLVGPNGAGKSTVICALNIFFRESDNASTDLLNLQEEDFHNKITAEPIRITVTFHDLNAEAQEDFKDYFRQGELVVSAEATYDAKSQTAVVKQYGQRNAIKALAPFFKELGDGKPVKELKIIYESLRKTIPELPAPGTKDAMIEALRAYETKHPEQCELIPSPDEFYGVSKGANRLAKYLQWVFVPAVKDAASEQAEAKNTALGKLLARTVRSKVNFAEDIDALRSKTQEA